MVDVLNFVVVKISNSSPKEGKHRMNEGSKVSNLRTNYKVVIAIQFNSIRIHRIQLFIGLDSQMSVFVCKLLTVGRGASGVVIMVIRAPSKQI